MSLSEGIPKSSTTLSQKIKGHSLKVRTSKIFGRFRLLEWSCRAFSFWIYDSSRWSGFGIYYVHPPRHINKNKFQILYLFEGFIGWEIIKIFSLKIFVINYKFFFLWKISLTNLNHVYFIIHNPKRSLYHNSLACAYCASLSLVFQITFNDFNFLIPFQYSGQSLYKHKNY